MSAQHKLSLYSAIFININIMLGSGIFINTTILSKKAGVLGAFSYVCIGLLMLPLILSMSKLLKLYPSGGFYSFARNEISPFAGFTSAWSYVIGKLASAVVIINISMLLLQQIIPALSTINTLILDVIILAIFVALNMLDIKTNSSIQKCFLGFKLVPILFGILVGAYYFSPSYISHAPIDWYGFPLTLPLVLFAIAGFEAAVSLSNQIENAQENTPKAIFISYGFVICITTLFQLFLTGALGSMLNSLADYRFVFPALISNLAIPASTQIMLTTIMHMAIIASALGGAYGIIFSNVWNIHTLAQHGHLFGSSALARLNKHSIPWICVLLEGTICLVYLVISRGNQIPLQQIGALGSSIAYSMSALSMVYAQRNNQTLGTSAIPYLAIGNCCLLMGTSIYGLIINGASSLITFFVLSCIGSWMFYSNAKQMNQAK